ncbi:MAG: 50S ribosomal protein L11 [Brevinematales bacterium]|jgi:large subunit ribosomal protein L11
MAPKAKKLKAVVKLQIQAGQANPAPPVGTALGPHGIPLMDFCKQFNEATKDKMGFVIPVVLNVYEDRTFTFVLKTPPASNLIKKELGLEKGSAESNKQKVGKITMEQLKKIAQIKMQDLNAKDIDAAARIIGGTARNMGIELEG